MFRGLRSLGSLARTLIGLAAVAVILFFLAWTLVSNWSELRSEQIELQPAYLVPSALVFAAAIFTFSVGWVSLVNHFSGQRGRPVGRLTTVFLYSWIARYVPGKVAYVVTRFYLGRSLGFGSWTLVGSIAYENALQLVAAFGFSFVAIVPYIARESGSVLPYLALPVLAAGGIVLLHPRVLHRALSIGLSLIGREPVPAELLLPPGRMVRMVVLYAAAFALYGTGFYLLVRSLTPYSAGYLPLASGAFALGSATGMVSLFAPAGLGVREGVTVAVLQLTMPVELAVLVSLASRVWATIIDLLVVGVSFAQDYVSGHRILFAALRQGQPVGAALDGSEAVSSLGNSTRPPTPGGTTSPSSSTRAES